MSESLATWHDFNVSVVAAAAALLGLLFVALSLHLRALAAAGNAELRAVARTVFLGYVVSLGMGFLGLIPQELGPYGVELLILVLLAIVPYALAARTGFRATGVGYERRVTVVQFLIGMVMFPSRSPPPWSWLREMIARSSSSARCPSSDSCGAFSILGS